MALEFISILRDIRDSKYPQIKAWYESIMELYNTGQWIPPDAMTTTNVNYVITNEADFATIPLDYKTASLNGSTFTWSATRPVDNEITYAGATGYWSRQHNSTIYASWYPYGGGTSDDTTAIQSAISTAQYGTLIFDGNKTYRYTTLDFSNVNVITNGATFKRLVANTTYGITIGDNVTMDKLNIIMLGTSTDRGYHITGSNVDIKKISCISELDGAHYAGEISSNQIGTQLQNITIGKIYSSKCATHLYARNVSALNIRSGHGKYYRIGCYFQDVVDSNVDGYKFETTGTTATGAAGENAFLVESTLSNGSTNNLRFNNCSAINSGEHGFRLGGQYTMNNVWFNNCYSSKSGSLHNSGGCGFKALGPTNNLNGRHTNIYFNNCIAEDCNTTGGIANFVGFSLGCLSNSYMSNCSVRKRDNTYSAQYGLLTQCVDNIFVNNFNSTDTLRSGLVVSTPDSSFDAYPGLLTPWSDIHITDSTFASLSTNSSVVRFEAIRFDASNFTMKNCFLKGDLHAFRAETPTSGTLSNINLDFTYTNSSANDSTYTDPIVYGYQCAVGNIRANWRPLASTPELLNGSKYLDLATYSISEKLGGVWGLSGGMSGTYNPTLYNVTNVDASAVVGVFNYLRVGNTINVSGAINIDNTTASTASELGISLPVASNFTSYSQCCGVGASMAAASLVGGVQGDATNERAALKWISTSTTDNRSWFVQFSYQIV